MINKVKKNTIFLLLITIVVMYFVLRNDFDEIIAALSNMNYLWLFIAILSYFGYIVFKSLVLHMIVTEEGGKYTFIRSLKHNLITQFFNGVTPFSTGGQPMEIYMLKKSGVNYSKGTNMIFQNFIFYQIALVLVGLIAVICNYYFNILQSNDLLNSLILIGFLINTFIAILFLFIMFNKKTTTFLIKKTIYLVNRFLKKNIVEDRWNNRIEEFHETADVLRKNKTLFIRGILVSIVSLLCLYIIPLFLLFAFGDYNSFNMLDAIVASAYVMIIGAFVPIPGGSGGIEYGFIEFFKYFVTGGVLSALLLVWRFITYYLPMIIGGIVFSFDKGDKKI